MVTANSLNEAIRKVCGEGTGIESRRPVFGGDINRAYALTLTDHFHESQYPAEARHL